MSPPLVTTLFFGFFQLLSFFSSVHGALYVVSPRDQSTCRGGEPCAVTWLDDGRAPLLSTIGISQVGLYTGDEQLLQTITPVDVGETLSLTFTPDPAVGPNSGAYYIAFRSTEVKNGTEPFVAYSPWFKLEGMQGSFDRPVPSATQSIPIPTTAEPSTTSTRTISTITVGKPPPSETPEPSMSISTPASSPSPSSTTSTRSSSSTRMTTSVVPTSTTTTPAASSTTESSSTSSDNAQNGVASRGVSWFVLCACVIAGALLS